LCHRIGAGLMHLHHALCAVIAHAVRMMPIAFEPALRAAERDVVTRV
jgi:hypothetical protein